MKAPRHRAAMVLLWPLWSWALLAAAPPATVAAAASDFPRCIADWRRMAQTQGLPPRIVDETIPNLRHLPKVIEYDRRQAEFTRTFAGYLNRRVNDARIKAGRAQYRQKELLLAELARKHGVPGRYLIAFWGLETKFGEVMGDMPTLDALATLACDPRRTAFFTTELMTALTLVARENIDTAQMRGSWAGAMGHTQFMPSSWRGYGTDGDGDGRVNLWASEADALSSAANFLQQLGWRRGEIWGREALLPADFPYHLSGYDNKRPLSEWADLNVTDAHGRPLPRLDLPAAILLPAGHTGPAFVVYPNFEVILKWNRSEHFALSVGILADHIIHIGALKNPPDPAEPPLSMDQIKVAQNKLNAQGLNAGAADGLIGPNTRRALRQYQQSAGLVADGYLGADTLARLLGETSGADR